MSRSLSFILLMFVQIMAKVRVMAGSTADSDSLSVEEDKKQLKKNTGAIKLLMQIYKKKGVTGWYKVCARIQVSA